jgi:hypothetical protein
MRYDLEPQERQAGIMAQEMGVCELKGGRNDDGSEQQPELADEVLDASPNEPRKGHHRGVYPTPLTRVPILRRDHDQPTSVICHR